MRNRCSLQDLVTRSRGRTLYLPILNRYVLLGYTSMGFTSKPDLGRIGFFSNSSSNFKNFSTTYFGTSSKSFSTLSSIRTSYGIVSLLNYFNFHLWLFSLIEI